MARALAPLLETIRDATDVADLRERLVNRAGHFFGATRSALFLFADFPSSALKTRENPLVRALFETHAPLHEAILLAPGLWKTLCPRADHEHVLVGPLVQGGEMVGVLAFTRAFGGPQFEAQDLADLSALCLHVSTRLERLAIQANISASVGWELSARERQIVGLVAQGLTNAQIAARLCVSSETVKQALKRMFRKTGVSSRAQLAAKFGAQVEASISTSARNSPNNLARAGG